jgi:NAD(P)-dependent dehydrogenase (short-subunit alcohol dehydrogenase family)
MTFPDRQHPGRPLRRARGDADAVVHLASDESRYTVGSELIIDGGMTNN